ncbi:uncharacterized protein MONBRDRAFT_12943 [Monosiga brevicollis MX1]|uniref:Uncharacterized protein n=1 Tax=Monosiga brevicollis TaxID=81824 RepID=A9VDT5_MONBE|nr:uncharacterized protein MONBRDRAFT_12943 [Monosiga brevicollis MX1]EDQ84316.1 predicted protein [Monosiga brevicollis MX1]|eukprot:XP_001750886.1 hypothetical protein [Monosiga brevicollis MX1]
MLLTRRRWCARQSAKASRTVQARQVMQVRIQQTPRSDSVGGVPVVKVRGRCKAVKITDRRGCQCCPTFDVDTCATHPSPTTPDPPDLSHQSVLCPLVSFLFNSCVPETTSTMAVHHDHHHHHHHHRHRHHRHQQQAFCYHDHEPSSAEALSPPLPASTESVTANSSTAAVAATPLSASLLSLSLDNGTKARSSTDRLELAIKSTFHPRPSNLALRRGTHPLPFLDTTPSQSVTNDEDHHEESWTPEELDQLFSSHTHHPHENDKEDGQTAYSLP